MTQPSGPHTPGRVPPQFPQPPAPVPPAVPMPPAGRFPPTDPWRAGGVAPPGAHFPPGVAVPPRRSPARPLIIAAAVAVALLLLGGGLATALYLNRGERGGVAASVTRPSASASASSGVVVYRRLPPCDTVPPETLTPLVPQGSLDGAGTSASGTRDGDAACSWSNVGVPDKRPPEIREIDLSLHAYDPAGDSPTGAAVKGLARRRSDGDGRAGRRFEHEADASVTALSGLGAGAFSQTYVMLGDDAPASGVRLYLVVGNVEAEIVYWGLDGTYEQGTPVPAAELSRGALAVAHTVVAWLTSCTDCGD